MAVSANAQVMVVPSTPLGTTAMINTDLSIYLREATNMSWGNLVGDFEDKYLTMWEGDWHQVATEHIKTSSFPPAAIAWVKMIERDRESCARDRAPFPMEHNKPDPINFSLWKDMVDEPWKYGDEIFEVLDLEDRLMRAARTRQRVLDYWHDKDVAVRQSPAAILIQRAWRNYKV